LARTNVAYIDMKPAPQPEEHPECAPGEAEGFAARGNEVEDREIAEIVSERLGGGDPETVELDEVIREFGFDPDEIEPATGDPITGPD
jgi:hypothetical protein